MDTEWEIENLKWNIQDLKRRVARLESESITLSWLDGVLEQMNEYNHALVDEHNHNSHGQGQGNPEPNTLDYP